MSLKRKILDELEKGPRRIKQLKAKLGNDKKLCRTLEELAREGRIKVRDGVYLAAPKKKEKNKGEVKGVLVKLAKGFGFVTPEEGEDIFIPGRFLQGVMPGDTVLVKELEHPQRAGSREGQIYAVLEEENRLVGTVEKIEGKLYLLPDKCPACPIQIKKSADGGVKPGEKAAAELLERGETHAEHRAGVTVRFGDAASAKQCAKAILYSAGIVKQFPLGCKAEAKKLEQFVLPAQELAKRKDLRQTPVFTIDAASTKDIDDAISIEKTPEGYVLGVHIADVSWFVKPGSQLDKEALRRGTSVYYADNVVPMLPRQLSNGVCSLNENEERLAFSCIMRLDKTGKLQDYDFVKSVICSRVKGVYAEINALYEEAAPERLREKYALVREELQALRELYDQLEARRHARGGMDIESDEAKLTLDENGVCIGVERRSRGLSERIIEECMLLANGCAAKLARRMGVPFVYRIHEPPEADRVDSLKKCLSLLGLPCAFGEAGPSQLELSALLDKTRGTPLERAAHTNILRTLSKAKYAPVAKGHYGLALEDYAHFTSPIRRYPDLAIHRILSDIVAGMEKEELIRRYEIFAQEASEQSSKQEVTAMQAERACEDCYKAEYIKPQVGEEFAGVISSVTPHGIYIAMDNTIEGLVRTADLSAHELTLTPGLSVKDALTGKSWRIGDTMRVKLAGVDVAQGNIDFIPAENNAPSV